MFLKAKSFRIFDGSSGSDWDQWNATGRSEYFNAKRLSKVGVHEKHFDAQRYFEAYPDVKAANKRGGEEWALKHFLQAGMFEIFSGRREDRIGLRVLGKPSVYVSMRVADGFLNVFGLPCSVAATQAGFKIVYTNGQLRSAERYDLDTVNSRSSNPESSGWIYGAFISVEPVSGVLVHRFENGRQLEDLIVSTGYSDPVDSVPTVSDASFANWIMSTRIITTYGATIPEFLEELFGEDPQLQKFHIEDVKIFNNACLLVRGWYLDLLETVESIVVLANDMPISFDPSDLVRVPRPDLMGIANHNYDAVYKAGFLGLGEYPKAKRKDASVLIAIISKSHVSWGIFPVHYVSDSARNALRSIVTTLPFPGHKQFARFIKAGAGKVMGNLLRETASEQVTYTEESYGVAPEGPVASVVIPLYGRMDFIKFQLAKFSEDEQFRNVDLIYVVDDPKHGEVARQIADFSAEVFDLPFRVIYLSKNQGYGGANNIGVKAARSDKVVLLNSDVFPRETGWLGRLLQPLSDSAIGIVGARLLYHDDTVQHDGLEYSCERYLGLDGLIMGIHRGKGIKPEGAVQEVLPVAAVTGAAMALRKTDFEQVGGFSPEYFIGDYEDSDLCMKVRGLGKEIVINKGCVLYHLERQSVTGDPASRIASIINAYTHHEKWRDELETHGLIGRN